MHTQVLITTETTYLLTQKNHEQNTNLNTMVMKEYIIQVDYKGKSTNHKVVANSFSKAVKNIKNKTGIGKGMHYSPIEFSAISINPIAKNKITTDLP